LKDKVENDKSSLISPSSWTGHFSNLNQLKNKFKERVAQLEEELSRIEGTPCFNELSVTISESEISKAISKIKCNKAPGLDNISNYMIKYGWSALLPVS
jgi:hypothetical protein